MNVMYHVDYNYNMYVLYMYFEIFNAYWVSEGLILYGLISFTNFNTQFFIN